jgi:Ferritin-like domain
MKQLIPTYRKSTDKEANAMASNDVEVLDPAAPVEKNTNTASGELDRRHFITALGVAGAAAGTALMVSSKAEAQQPNPGGFAQVDVLNLMLNIKYLKATLYSFITQGADLPPSSYVTNGTGQVFNQPAKITFSNQQITDVFNEMYYDELNQLIALRALQGTATANRATMNILGTGPSGTAPSSTTTTMTQSQAIAMARMLEDLSASAFAISTVYLTGTNLAYAAQALATDGYHAGLLRLLCIQNGIQYQGTQYQSVTTSNTAQSAITFTGSATAGSPIIYSMLPANLPAVGNVLTGIGIPPLAGAIITAVTAPANAALTAISNKSNLLTNVSNVTGLVAGMPITGTSIPANTVISAVGTNTITLSAATTAASTVAPTGFVTSGSAVVTGVSSTSGLIAGQTITGTGIPANTTVVSFSSSAATITMSLPATVTPSVSLTGNLTLNSPTIASISTSTGFSIGSPISGTGIPAGTTVTAISATTITMSANATASGTGVKVSTPTTSAVTSPTTQAITVGLTAITIAQPLTVTGMNPYYVVLADSLDVQPGDPGTAALSASGPVAIAGTSPTMYQGFFNTAGAGTSSATSTPAGFAFARSFQQILAVLYGYNSTNSAITTQNYQGGFFPFGVSGQINSAI